MTITVAQRNLLDTLESKSYLSAFLRSLRATGLERNLARGGPYTIFAPDDGAFKDLPAGTMTNLLRGKDELKDILNYHIIRGRHLTRDLARQDSLPTIEGQAVTIGKYDGLRVGRAQLVETDIECDNGIVHVIDRVLIPKPRWHALPLSRRLPSVEAGPGPLTHLRTSGGISRTRRTHGTKHSSQHPRGDTMKSSTDMKDIVSTASEGDFKTLVKALKETGLDTALKENGPFTLFAPADEVFNDISPETFNDLFSDREFLTKILQYHIVNGKVMSSDLVNGITLPTLHGDTINISSQNGMLSANDAEIVTPDIECTNGVIHIIDSILVPSPQTASV